MIASCWLTVDITIHRRPYVQYYLPVLGVSSSPVVIDYTTLDRSSRYEYWFIGCLHGYYYVAIIELRVDAISRYGDVTVFAGH